MGRAPGNWCLYLEDLVWNNADLVARFDKFLPELHDYLSDLGAQNQPLGLHTFGEVPNEAHLISTLVQMAGKRFIEPAERYAEQLNDHPHEHTNSNDHDGMADYRTLNQTPEYQLVKTFVIDGVSLDEIKDDELRDLLIEAKANYTNFRNIEENSALLEALAGKYVSSSTGGDPIRSPEALPSGRNLYGFDPSKIPTQAAWQSGKVLMDDLIANYFNDHRAYPDKVTFSMWSIETMRHLAQMIERMLEAARKEYWTADAETLKELLETYIELAQKYDVFTQNETFNQYVNDQATGFGLAPLMSLTQAEAVQPQAAPQPTFPCE